MEKFRTGEYEVHNLTVIDESCSRVLDVGGLRLRLFGLGGAVAHHKMCQSHFLFAHDELELTLAQSTMVSSHLLFYTFCSPY